MLTLTLIFSLNSLHGSTGILPVQHRRDACAPGFFR